MSALNPQKSWHYGGELSKVKLHNPARNPPGIARG